MTPGDPDLMRFPIRDDEVWKVKRRWKTLLTMFCVWFTHDVLTTDINKHP